MVSTALSTTLLLFLRVIKRVERVVVSRQVDPLKLRQGEGSRAEGCFEGVQVDCDSWLRLE